MHIRYAAGVERVVLLVTVADYNRRARFKTASLSITGHNKAAMLYQTYQPLVMALRERFRDVSYYASLCRPATLTAYFLGDATDIKDSTLLEPGFTLHTFQGGSWIEKARKTLREKRCPADRRRLIQRFLDDFHPAGFPEVAAEGERLRQFVLSSHAKFRVAVVFEPTLSLALLDYLPREELGFNPCEGALVQVKGEEIVLVERVVLGKKPYKRG